MTPPAKPHSRTHALNPRLKPRAGKAVSPLKRASTETERASAHLRAFALSHFRTFALSHFRTFALSHFRTFALSHFRTFALSHFRTFALSHYAPSHLRTLAPSHPPLRRHRLLAPGAEAQLPSAGLPIDNDGFGVVELALQDVQRQRVLHQALDGALQRPRAVGRVVALLRDELLGRVRH